MIELVVTQMRRVNKDGSKDITKCEGVRFTRSQLESHREGFLKQGYKEVNFIHHEMYFLPTNLKRSV